MKKGEIRAVEMVRRVRDRLHAEHRDKGPAERIAAYRARAREVHEKLGLPMLEDLDSEIQEG